jgi:hypothetical protein
MPVCIVFLLDVRLFAFEFVVTLVFFFRFLLFYSVLVPSAAKEKKQQLKTMA